MKNIKTTMAIPLIFKRIAIIIPFLSQDKDGPVLKTKKEDDDFLVTLLFVRGLGIGCWVNAYGCVCLTPINIYSGNIKHLFVLLHFDNSGFNGDRGDLIIRCIC